MRQTLLKTILRKEVIGLARLVIGVLAVFLILLEFGYQSSEALLDRLGRLSDSLVAAATIATFGSIVRTWLRKAPQRLAELIWFVIALFLLVGRPLGLTPWAEEDSWPNQVFLTFYIFIEFSRLELGLNTRLFNPALLFVASFIVIIFIGTALFMLPNSATRPLTLTEALFTATSAVCVTGITVIDISQDLTRSGQWLLMLLFQVGGLGVMTFTSFFAFFFKGRSTLEEQLRIRDIANTSLSSARSFIVQVILFTVGLELLGAAFVFLSTDPALFPDIGEHLFFSVFHAISAFNNAGFSTLQNGIYNDVMRFNYPMMWIISLLIIFGGLGFGIIFNFSRYLYVIFVGFLRKIFSGEPRSSFPREVTVSTRIVLKTSALLVILGAIILAVFEWNGPSLAEHSTWGKVSVIFFTSSASRTAGFAAVDFSMISTPAIMFTLLLMYVGASPGSTGGGIKTTTFALAILNIFATARGRKRVEFAGREISDLSIRRAFATIFISILFLGVAITTLATLEPQMTLLPIVFECFSAFSTVGQSMNLTPSFSDESRWVLIVVMFIGRVSVLTLLVGVLRQADISPYRYPKEDIIIN